MDHSRYYFYVTVYWFLYLVIETCEWTDSSVETNTKCFLINILKDKENIG